MHCTQQLKVRQNRNDFFKPKFPPKENKRIQFYYYETCFRLVFWRKLKTPKRHFEINWPLVDLSTACDLTVIKILFHVDDQKMGIYWMRFLKVDPCGMGMPPLRNFFWALASPSYIMPCILSEEIQLSVFSRTCYWTNARFYKKENKNKSLGA